MQADQTVITRKARRAALVVLGTICAIASADSHSATVQIEGGRTIVEVDSARPLAEAVMALMAEYDRPITYEDPQYAYEEDLEDVTERVRKDLAAYPPGKAPKVIVPRGGKLSVSSSSTDVAAILDQLVEAENGSGRGARFRVEREEEFLHVLPTGARDRNGNWAPQPSILDAPISLEVRDRYAIELVDAICSAVTAAARVKLSCGGFGLSGGISDGRPPPRYRFGAEDEPARSVLIRALRAVAADRGLLTWLLFYGFYGTDDGQYMLNLIPAFHDRPPPRAPGSPSAAGARPDASSKPQNVSGVVPGRPPSDMSGAGATVFDSRSEQ